jgi:molybdopterin molybdotransferase
MTEDSSNQRIARLTPLSAILGLIEARVSAVKPQKIRPVGVEGRTIAEDVAAVDLPPRAIALRDGYAVSADAIADAGPYAPLPFASMPARVDAGEPLPDGTDAVLPLDAVNTRGDRAEAIAGISPGEGALAAGGDANRNVPLQRAGAPARNIDVAAFSAAGVEAVSIREPRIGVALGGDTGGTVINAALAMLVRAIFNAGSVVTNNPVMLDAALADVQADAIIAVGGTGSGRRDDAVQILARLGQVEAHGIAVSPGETAAFGFAGARPVLLIPGRLDAAVAIWLLIGRHIIAKLAGGSVEDPPTLLPLKRKVTSTIGMTDLIPVSCAGGVAEPLASGYLSFTALTQSDGWIVVPPDSEGFGAGTEVAVRPWP